MLYQGILIYTHICVYIIYAHMNKNSIFMQLNEWTDEWKNLRSNYFLDDWHLHSQSTNDL